MRKSGNQKNYIFSDLLISTFFKIILSFISFFIQKIQMACFHIVPQLYSLHNSHINLITNDSYLMVVTNQIKCHQFRKHFIVSIGADCQTFHIRFQRSCTQPVIFKSIPLCLIIICRLSGSTHLTASPAKFPSHMFLT